MVAQVLRRIRQAGLGVAAALWVLAAIPVPVQGASATYEHDARGRLTKATYDDGTVVDYSYDNNGNAGDSVENSQTTLRVDFGSGNHSARVRVTSADDSIVGRFLWTTNRTSTRVAFDTTIITPEGTTQEAFSYRGTLPPGAFYDFPLTGDARRLPGPGSIALQARNLGALDAAVILRVINVEAETCRSP